MENKALLVEQYKAVRERANKHEEVRFQLLAVNVAAFGAIFALSGKLVDPVIPFALMGALLVCSRWSLGAQSLATFATAFMIERYGTLFDRSSYETGYARWLEEHQASSQSPRAEKTSWSGKLLSITRVLLEPFIVLTTVSLVGGFIVSYQFWHSQWTSNGRFIVLGCALILLVGHAAAVVLVLRNGKLSLERTRLWWRQYLAEHEVDDVQSSA